MLSIGDALVVHLACVGELSTEDRAAIRSIKGEVRTYPKQRDIMRVGDKPDESMIVLKGHLCRYTIGHDGARQVQSFHMPTETPSLETLHIDYMDMNLATVTEAKIGAIKHTELQRVLTERPNVLSVVWRETLVQASITREWLVRNSTLPAHASMAHLFCEIFTRAQAVGLTRDMACDFPVSQEMLADSLGITAVHVNRTLQVLREADLVEFKGGLLTVKDIERLQVLADFDPLYLHLHC